MKTDTTRNKLKTALASDFDGTLFFQKSEEQFKKGDLEKIREYQAAGGLFGLCSGRSLNGVERTTEDRIDFDFYILASGALILDKNKNILYKHCIPASVVKTFTDVYRPLTETKIHANGLIYQFGNYHEHMPLISDMSEIPMTDPDGFFGISCRVKSVEEGKQICADMNERFGAYVTAFQNVIDIDIVAAGVSKGAGIRKVKKLMGIDRIGAIGDSFNDIPMLEAADCAFTFPYAPTETKNCADTIVESVEQALKVMESLSLRSRILF